jgi:microsomal dipeptidase-like Zn-dependent dipeptidase
MQGHGEIPRFAGILLERGYSTEEVRGILGANALRVFRQVLKG